MFGRKLSKLFASVLALVSFSIGGGVYATWEYFFPAEPRQEEVRMGLNEFVWAPEEVLPDDTANQSSHMAVIQELLFNNKVGLNGSKTALEEAVEKKGLLSYLDNIQGSNLKHFILDTNGGQKLGFMFEYVNENTFYAYTFYRLELDPGDKVAVYKTIFERNTDASVDKNEDGKMDKWVASGSISGHAVVELLPYSNEDYGIDVKTWLPHRLLTENTGENLE